jgi:hypothetical protein
MLNVSADLFSFFCRGVLSADCSALCSLTHKRLSMFQIKFGALPELSRCSTDSNRQELIRVDRN